MSLSGMQEEVPACNTRGALSSICRKAPCSFRHPVDRIIGTSLTCPASSVLDVCVFKMGRGQCATFFICLVHLTPSLPSKITTPLPLRSTMRRTCTAGGHLPHHNGILHSEWHLQFRNLLLYPNSTGIVKHPLWLVDMELHRFFNYFIAKVKITLSFSMSLGKSVLRYSYSDTHFVTCRLGLLTTYSHPPLESEIYSVRTFPFSPSYIFIALLNSIFIFFRLKS